MMWLDQRLLHGITPFMNPAAPWHLLPLVHLRKLTLKQLESGTLTSWKKNLAVGPFSLSTDTLVRKDVKKQVSNLQDGKRFDLVNVPTIYDEAWGAACSYLSGTSEYLREKEEGKIRHSGDFKALGVNNFRTKKAQEVRDKKLCGGQVNFLLQALRYRGKANYRDSIYLSYGSNLTQDISQLLKDLFVVGRAFFMMASTYVSRRVDSKVWKCFVGDLETNCRISISPGLLFLSKK